jgi:hypothetical protein
MLWTTLLVNALLQIASDSLFRQTATLLKCANENFSANHTYLGIVTPRTLNTCATVHFAQGAHVTLVLIIIAKQSTNISSTTTLAGRRLARLQARHQDLYDPALKWKGLICVAYRIDLDYVMILLVEIISRGATIPK